MDQVLTLMVVAVVGAGADTDGGGDGGQVLTLMVVVASSGGSASADVAYTFSRCCRQVSGHPGRCEVSSSKRNNHMASIFSLWALPRWTARTATRTPPGLHSGSRKLRRGRWTRLCRQSCMPQARLSTHLLLRAVPAAAVEGMLVGRWVAATMHRCCASLFFWSY